MTPPLPCPFSVGDKVRVRRSSPYADDWRNTECLVTGITLKKNGSMNIWINEDWPRIGDTDGWLPDDLELVTRAPGPAADQIAALQAEVERLKGERDAWKSAASNTAIERQELYEECRVRARIFNALASSSNATISSLNSLLAQAADALRQQTAVIEMWIAAARGEADVTDEQLANRPMPASRSATQPFAPSTTRSKGDA